MAEFITAICGIGWIFIFALDMAYERPRPTKGTGPLSKWLRRRYLTKPLVSAPLALSVVATSLPIAILVSTTIGSVLMYVGFWLPLGIYDAIDWLGEEDRYRRFKRGTSEKVKQLLARLKPAPQRPIPTPT